MKEAQMGLGEKNYRGLFFFWADPHNICDSYEYSTKITMSWPQHQDGARLAQDLVKGEDRFGNETGLQANQRSGIRDVGARDGRCTGICSTAWRA